MTNAEPADSAQTPKSDVDHLFPGYTHVEQVGAGGFARVYKATSTQFRRVEAIKVLNMALSDDRDLKRFESECALLGQLEHPSIIDVHQAGESAHGEPFLAMAYAANGSLDDRLKRGESFSIREVLAIAIKLCGALQTAHGVGVVHRDIKPSNVLLNQYGQPKLADFGVARLVTEASTELSIALTPAFAAPEQFRRPPNSPEGADVVTRATDVFSLASTVWALLLGSSPFGGREDPFLDVAERVTSAEPFPFDRADLPDGLEEALLGAMAKDPMARPTASSLGRRLQQIEKEAGFSATELVFVKDPSGAPMLSEIELPPSNAASDDSAERDEVDADSAEDEATERKGNAAQPPPVEKSPAPQNNEATIRPPTTTAPGPLPRRSPTQRPGGARPTPPERESVAAVRTTSQSATGRTAPERIVDSPVVEIGAEAAEESQRRRLGLLVPAAFLLVLVAAGWVLNGQNAQGELDAVGTPPSGSATTAQVETSAVTVAQTVSTLGVPLAKPLPSEGSAIIVTTSTSQSLAVPTSGPAASSTVAPTTTAPITTSTPPQTVSSLATTTTAPTTTAAPVTTTTARVTTTTARVTTTTAPVTTTTAPITTTTVPVTTTTLPITTTTVPVTTTTVPVTTTTTSTTVSLGVIPPQPTNVRIEVFDHQTIDIYWDHDGTDLTETIVSLGCCGGVLGDQRYSSDVRSARIAGLSPSIVYVANVIAVGPTGADGTKATADPVRVEATTPAALPPAPVTNVQTQAGTKSIEVTWDHDDALLDEFVVTVGCCGGVLTERRLPANTRSYRFEGLQTGVDHVIDIQALGTPSTAGTRLGSTVTRAAATQPN